jgi:CubicO group peptidase (beta-lactamase class C family)
MGHTRWRAEAFFAALVGIVVAIGGGIALWVYTAVPVHPDVASVPSTAGALVQRYSDAIEEGRGFARALVAIENLPGLSVAVAVDDELVWAEGFGWANIEGREPITPRTRFRLGAASKPLTAAAVALLHDRGRLDLDAPIQTYVTDYPQKPWPLTPRQLMSDVGGVHRIRGDNNDAMPGEQCANLGEALPLFAGEPLLFQPGTQHRYSIYGWILLSVLVERVGGEPFHAFMARELFEPLGMKGTVLEEPGGLPASTTTLYGRRKAGRVEPADPTKAHYSCLAGAGAFVSTPSDLARFGAAVLKPGFLKGETIAAMQAPFRLESGRTTDYALGWKVESVALDGKPARLIGHRGSPMGGAVSLLTFPDLGLVVAVASNIGGTSVDPLAQKLAEVFMVRSGRTTSSKKTASR